MKFKIRHFHAGQILQLVMILLVTTSLVHAEGIYRWVDDQGRVHFADDKSAAPDSQDISGDLKPNTVSDNSAGEYLKKLFRRTSGKAISITGNITRKDQFRPFSMTVYHLLPPLLPKARLLHIVPRRDSLWFASDSGLIEFNRKTEDWYLYNRKNGLPGDTAYNITHDGDRLFLRIYNWSSKHSLSGGGNYWFDVEQQRFEKAHVTLEQVEAKGSFTPKNSDALGYSPSNVLHYRGRVWLTYTGRNTVGSRKFTGGGVVKLHPLTKRGRIYTTNDGLANSYCYDITSSENNSVWVTHWHEERGISYLNDDSGRWQVLKKSRNGIELGGVRIAAVDQFILIGQQRALVIYDKRSGLAYSVDEAEGLPGYIVSDILVDKDTIWVSVYGYGKGGSDRGGLVKIARAELHRFFDLMIAADKEMQAEQQAQQAPPRSN